MILIAFKYSSSIFSFSCCRVISVHVIRLDTGFASQYLLVVVSKIIVLWLATHWCIVCLWMPYSFLFFRLISFFHLNVILEVWHFFQSLILVWLFFAFSSHSFVFLVNSSRLFAPLFLRLLSFRGGSPRLTLVLGSSSPRMTALGFLFLVVSGDYLALSPEARTEHFGLSYWETVQRHHSFRLVDHNALIVATHLYSILKHPMHFFTVPFLIFNYLFHFPYLPFPALLFLFELQLNIQYLFLSHFQLLHQLLHLQMYLLYLSASLRFPLLIIIIIFQW